MNLQLLTPFKHHVRVWYEGETFIIPRSAAAAKNVPDGAVLLSVPKGMFSAEMELFANLCEHHTIEPQSFAV